MGVNDSIFSGKFYVQWEIILKILFLKIRTLSHKMWFIMRNIFLKSEKLIRNKVIVNSTKSLINVAAHADVRASRGLQILCIVKLKTASSLSNKANKNFKHYINHLFKSILNLNTHLQILNILIFCVLVFFF